MGDNTALSFTVETLDDRHHGSHRLADFARLAPAIRAAKESLKDKRTTLAVVKDRDGALVYCVDNRTEWAGRTPALSLGDVAGALAAYRRSH